MFQNLLILKEEMKKMSLLKNIEKNLKVKNRNIKRQININFDIDEMIISPSDLMFVNHKDPLGGGSYGIVLRKIYQGKEVAYKKFYNMSQFKSFLTEVKLMRNLEHDNIANFIGLVIQPDNFGIVMNIYPDGSLFDLLYKVTSDNI